MTDERTLFRRVDLDLNGLLNYIDIGDIGLPDIQRPFIWKPKRVRDLFDSMYRGFPIGYLLFWDNQVASNTRQIGLDNKVHHIPKYLIIDGQQRLTSLYSVIKGKQILNENYQKKKIEIAFRPRDGLFEVSDAAIKKDPEFIPDISTFWSANKGSWSIINTFIKNLEMKTNLTEEDKERISRNIDRVFDLQKYPFSVLEIAQNVDEEQVAEIFVRINGEGVKLNQGDFILTLLSVFWEEGRKQLEIFCKSAKSPPDKDSRTSPFNHFIQPQPDQVIRVMIAVGFHRGRLKNAYQILRGKNPETGEVSEERRNQQFDILKDAQVKTLNLTYWHQFFSSLIGAGYRSNELITSENALLYSYAFYLLGKTKFNIPEHTLQRLIGRWFYAINLSQRYTGSFETVMEGDLTRIKDLTDPNSFIDVLEKIISDTLTNDFWTITLPNNLETSSGQSPYLYTYYAAQNLLDTPVLFSHKKVADLLDPTIKSKKKALEKHHLFPKGWLEKQSIGDLKLINQVANFALLEWPDNIKIGDMPPFEYLPKIKSRFSTEIWERMCNLHALPLSWENLQYEVFLKDRRTLMAQVIKRGYETLSS